MNVQFQIQSAHFILRSSLSPLAHSWTCWFTGGKSQQWHDSCHRHPTPHPTGSSPPSSLLHLLFSSISPPLSARRHQPVNILHHRHMTDNANHPITQQQSPQLWKKSLHRLICVALLFTVIGILILSCLRCYARCRQKCIYVFNNVIFYVCFHQLKTMHHFTPWWHVWALAVF